MKALTVGKGEARPTTGAGKECRNFFRAQKASHVELAILQSKTHDGPLRLALARCNGIGITSKPFIGVARNWRLSGRLGRLGWSGTQCSKGGRFQLIFIQYAAIAFDSCPLLLCLLLLHHLPLPGAPSILGGQGCSRPRIDLRSSMVSAFSAA